VYNNIILYIWYSGIHTDIAFTAAADRRKKQHVLRSDGEAKTEPRAANIIMLYSVIFFTVSSRIAGDI